ncbi:HIT family protein [Inquilinus limosus]|uniref:HIT family protein n=1 Tax=Inquilinus limosus TaxID=171674 RepID=A0A211YUF2_9PROT|nr:HIT family protein [Inquilinus limosus]OWJ56544.1 HIT family protein [Inquilinus limosus]
MSLDGTYDRDNVFARILRGELPAAKVHEDGDTLAFMDAFPQSEGHVLVIPRAGTARNLLEADPATLARLMATVQRVAAAVRAALRPDGVMVAQFNGAAAGQTVYHLHVHVIPRWEGRPMKGHGQAGPADAAELRAQAARIAAAMTA